jgi:hypothetical protein
MTLASSFGCSLESAAACWPYSYLQKYGGDTWRSQLTYRHLYTATQYRLTPTALAIDIIEETTAVDNR